MCENKRASYIDAIAGFLIVYMIFYHIMQWAKFTDTKVYSCFEPALGFFMAWFSYKAGMFYRPKSNIDLLKSGWTRLIIPFITYSLIGYIVWCFYRALATEPNLRIFLLSPLRELLKKGSISGNLPLWWLTSLFMARFLFNIIETQMTRARYPLFFLCLGVPVFCHYLNIKVPYYITNIPLIISFMFLGYHSKGLAENKVLLLVATSIYVLSLVLYPSAVDMRSNKLLCGDYLVWALSSISSIFLINYLFSIFHYSFRLLTFIGKNSIFFFCTHWVILILLRCGFIYFGWNYPGKFFLISAIVLCSCLVPYLIIKRGVNGD